MNFKTLLLSIVCGLSIPMLCQQGAQPNGQGNPNMALTPEGAEIMEAALQEFAQAWEKMSPEEQEQFFKIYDEMAKLPPEELSKMVNEQYGVPVFVPSDEVAPTTPEPTPLPEPAKEAAQPEEAVKKAETPHAKQQEAASLLSNIIDRINSFLHKAQIMPEFSGKLRKWTEQGKIKGWNPSFTWAKVKSDIELLVHTLEKINEKDKKTKTYKFLNDLIENESLMAHLNKLHGSLKLHEPAVFIEELGVEPMSKESRKAMRNVINALVEALYALSMQANLDAVIEKYEPIAKKSRETEEAATKKAIEESKKERFGRPGVTAGYGDQQEGYYGGSYNPYGGGSDSGYYSPDYPSYGGNSDYGSYNEPDRASTNTPTKSDSEKSGGSDKGGRSSSDDKKDSKEDKRLSRLVGKIDSSLDEADKAITDSRLQDIQKHLLDSGPADANTASSFLPTAVKRIQAAVDSLEVLKARAHGNKNNEYVQQAKDAYEEHKKSFDTVLKQIKQVKGSLGQISPDKKAAFFAAPSAPAPKAEAKRKADADKGEKETAEDLSAPAAPTAPARSLYDLEDAIESLQKLIKSLQ